MDVEKIKVKKYFFKIHSLISFYVLIKPQYNLHNQIAEILSFHLMYSMPKLDESELSYLKTRML